MKKLNDYIVLFVSLGVAFVFVYFIPAALNRVLFFIFIYLFYKSDKDYLWLAFILIIMEQPGGLFGGGERTDVMRIPVYSLGANFSISFQQIFIFTALIKAIKKNVKFNPATFLKNNLISLSVYFIFLVFVGIGVGFSVDVGGFIFGMIVNLSLFYSVYCLFRKESDYINFFRILIPFGFIAFGLQFYRLTSGYRLIYYFKPPSKYIDIYTTTELIRPEEMPHIVGLLFFFSLYFLLYSKKYFNRNLLIAINIISFFSIIITATRSWVIMFVIFYVLSFLFISFKFGNILFRYGLSAVFIIIMLFTAELFTGQLNKAMERIATIENIAEGDITAGGTLSRFDVRAPAVMEAYYNESTVIFGAGFSKTYLEKADGHVGFHNLLFNSGIVGIALFAVFLGSIIINSFKISGRLNNNNPYKDVLKIFPIIIISILLINGGNQFFGYDVPYYRLFVIAFVLYYLNNQISCAVQWENEND